MRNEGPCVKYEDLKEDMLTTFAEGSVALESLLKYCYSKHVITRACCAGHAEVKLKVPQIGFAIPMEQAKIMEGVIGKLFSDAGMKERIVVKIRKEGEDFVAFYYLNDLTEQVREGFFNCIREVIANALDYDDVYTSVFSGLFEAYKNIGDSSLEIKKDGISVIVSSPEVSYFQMKNGTYVEVPKELAEELAKTEQIFTMPIQCIKEKIAPEDIGKFISNNRNFSNSGL